MNNSWINIKEQLAHLPAIYDLKDLDTTTISSGDELQDALARIWPGIAPVQQGDMKPLRASRVSVRMSAQTSTLQELSALVSKIEHETAQSLQPAPESAHESHQSQLAANSSEDSPLSTWQRLAQNPAFSLPSRSTPFATVEPIAMEGESASEVLVRERR